MKSNKSKTEQQKNRNGEKKTWNEEKKMDIRVAQSQKIIVENIVIISIGLITNSSW